MVNVVDRPTEAAPSGKRRRWRLVAIIAGCVVVLAPIGVGLGFWRYAATYAPLQEGPFAGPFQESGNALVRRATDLGDEVYIRGPAGTEVQEIFTIENHGPFDVTVDKIQKSSMLPRVEWSPYVLVPGGNAVGKALPLRPFPAVVKSQQSIRVLLTLRRPVCGPGEGIVMYSLITPWHALGVHHQTELPFPGDAQFVGCPHPPK